MRPALPAAVIVFLGLALAALANVGPISGPVTFSNNFSYSGGVVDVKLNSVPNTAGWIAGNDPTGAPVMEPSQTTAFTVTEIDANIEVPTGLSPATVYVYTAPSGTACNAGTLLSSGYVDGNGTASTNQTLTLSATSIPIGNRICLYSPDDSGNWTAGAGVGGITVYVKPS